MTIKGVVREGEVASQFMQSEHIQDNMFVIMKPSTLYSKYYPQLPSSQMVPNAIVDELHWDFESGRVTYIDMLRDLPMKKTRRDEIEFYVSPEKHLAYMITWYGMCLWILASGAYLIRRRGGLK